MTWLEFSYFAIPSLVLWFAAIVFYFLKAKFDKASLIANILTITGLIIFGTFIVLLWYKLERPPMRTLGETRLWYAIFLPLVGLVTYLRWRYAWFVAFSLFLANVFVVINIFLPETHDKTLMPALQSQWFVPHVVVYIFSYALLAASSLVAARGLYELHFRTLNSETLQLADNLVYLGFSLLTFGLIFGAFWAKEAWGHYWTWDPKETWAFLTWIAYLIYIHFRFHKPRNSKTALWALSLAFVVLLICWFGINYLPSAQNSVHVYS